MTAIADRKARSHRARPALPGGLGGRRLAGLIAGLALITLFALAAGSPAAQRPSAGAFFIPGDPQQGMRTFFDKGCARCHAVLDEGGRSAPDLARAPAGHLGASELVAELWNHAPAMWEKMRAERFTPPKLDETEMANLFAFLYAARSLDEPGDPARGRMVLAEKRCGECHAITGPMGGGSRTAPDLREWAGNRNPVAWVQAMWNHAPAMQASMQARGLAWPQFRGGELSDLLAYIRTHAPASRSRAYLRPGNPQAGRALFTAKGCAQCHGAGGKGGIRASDLSRETLPRTLGQLAAVMWNHAPAMGAGMQASAIARPHFSNAEMADLIAYLFAERFFDRQASGTRGMAVFRNKGCTSCHAPGNEAPDLSAWRGRASPIPLAAALWSHGPLMLERMRQQQIAWPRFQPGEMADLMEHLGSGRATGQAMAARQQP